MVQFEEEDKDKADLASSVTLGEEMVQRKEEVDIPFAEKFVDMRRNENGCRNEGNRNL